MSDWELIETAPKDGTPILAFERGWQYPLSIRWHAGWRCWTLNGVLLKLAPGAEPEVWAPLPEPPLMDDDEDGDE